LIYRQGLVVEHGQCPELIYQDVSKASDILDFIEDEDIIVFGPGLGQGLWANQVWKTLQSLNHRMVVDASALAPLAKHLLFRPNWVITPHPGEAGLLLNKTASVVQSDRFEAIQTLYSLIQATVVLKGAGTMVLGKQHPLYICPLGNPGMATPGMGDILSGLIAGSWAQGLSSMNAALYAVWMHALAGDVAQKKSMSGIVLASQVLQQIQCGFKK
jgi:NAD(P)H-hydrate epimerase